MYELKGSLIKYTSFKLKTVPETSTHFLIG